MFSWQWRKKSRFLFKYIISLNVLISILQLLKSAIRINGPNLNLFFCAKYRLDDSLFHPILPQIACKLRYEQVGRFLVCVLYFKKNFILLDHMYIKCSYINNSFQCNIIQRSHEFSKSYTLIWSLLMIYNCVYFRTTSHMKQGILQRVMHHILGKNVNVKQVKINLSNQTFLSMPN